METIQKGELFMIKFKKMAMMMLASVMTVSVMGVSAVSAFAAGNESISANVAVDSGIVNYDDDNGISLQWFFTKTYVVTANNVNVRSGPGTNYAILGTYNANTEIKVKSIDNGWAKFEYGSGYAYISADYIREK